jgi:effector-binding domain-containing protein
MRIKRCPLVFNNVISTKVTCKTSEWHNSAIDLRNAVIKNGLYGIGPIIYQIANFNKQQNEAEYTFYLPINAPIKMSENDKYNFYETWKFDDGLVLRHADLEEDIIDSYEMLKACADANKLKLLEPFYNIYLDVYGDGIIDIYAPIIHS